MSSLAPVPSSDSPTCSHCGAALVADQRYCLSCGQPCSPVRLAFLDVLSTEQQPQLGAGTVSAAPVAYAQYVEPAPGPAWLRRYAPLFAVLSVLLLCADRRAAGRPLGHPEQSPGRPAGDQGRRPQRRRGDGAAATAATTPTTSTTTPAAASRPTASSSKEEKQEEAEAKAEEAKKSRRPGPGKVSSSTLTKIEKSTGRKHQEELNKIGTAPIAVP